MGYVPNLDALFFGRIQLPSNQEVKQEVRAACSYVLLSGLIYVDQNKHHLYPVGLLS